MGRIRKQGYWKDDNDYDDGDDDEDNYREEGEDMEEEIGEEVKKKRMRNDEGK